MMPYGIHTAVPSGPPRDIRWTVDQFHYLGDLGCFEGRRAMLIDGSIVEEGPMNPPHRLALELTAELLRGVFARGWRHCVQMPLVLGQRSDPEPDIAIVAGSARGAVEHPTSATLVVEISDSSLRYDTTDKMRLYAAAGIADYWVLDVTGRQLLVHRNPRPEPTERFGHGYADVTTFGPDDTVTPLAVPGAAVRVGDMLP
ncbi:MAG: Uma2 family endonuclease [Fimbriiglobus sp.]